MGRVKLSERLSEGAPLAAVVLVVSAVVLLLVYTLLPILKVVALALLLALVLRTAVLGLERLGAPRWLSVVMLLSGIALFFVFVWFFIVPNLLNEVRILISDKGQGSLGSVVGMVRDLPILPDPSQVFERLKGSLSHLIGSLPSIVFTATSAMAGIVAAIFLAVYFAVDPDTYITGILRLLPRQRRGLAREFLDRLGSRMRGWVLGTILVATFVGMASGFGLWILGVPLALTFGIIAGVLNVVPFLGSIVGGLLPALMALTISPWKALEVVALFVVINQIEGNVLQPKIMGGRVRVPTAMILVSFLVTATLLGPILGALLAVPAAVLVGVVLDELTEKAPSLGDDEEAKKKR